MMSTNFESFGGSGDCVDSNEYLTYAKRIFDKLNACSDFNRVAKKVIPIFASEDTLIVELTVEEEHVNSKKTLHGGQTAALVDMITARAVGLTIRDRGMVSVELAISYMLPVILGEVLEIRAVVLKSGRQVAFTEAEFRRKSDGKIVAKGKHTLMLLNKPVSETDEHFEQF